VVSYRLPFPPAWIQVAAMTLPWLELLCGMLLLVAGFHRAALGWCLVIFTLFALVTLQAWWRGLAIQCGSLDLPWLGLGVPGQAAGSKFLHSAPVAFGSALVLLGAAVYLWLTPSGGSRS